MTRRALRIVLARPRGFCAGVVRAVDIVERTLERFGAPVHVRHEIVHNRHVVDDFRRKGARFVEELDEVPDSAITVFSAHGVAPSVETDAVRRNLHVIDATCPLVRKIHNDARRFARQGYDVVLIGHSGHPEVIGTMGQVDGPVHLVSTVEEVAALRPASSDRLAYVTQTTLSVDDTRDIIAALQARFPGIAGPEIDGICYATQNRQTAVRALATDVDLILVIGARNSSNSNRLREIGNEAGVETHLVSDAGMVDPAWLNGKQAVGITAGASAPEFLVQEMIDHLGTSYDIAVTEMDGPDESVYFKLPRELQTPDEADRDG